MATVVIQIDGVPGSDTDLALGDTITFSNQDNTGVATWGWELLDIPLDSSAMLTSAVAATTDLTLDKEGSYLVRLIANAGMGTEERGLVVVGVRHLKTRLRYPAAGERLESDPVRGWASTRNSDLDRLNDLLTSGGVHMGMLPAAEVPPNGMNWLRGDVVQLVGIVDINTTGDIEIVPVWEKPDTSNPRSVYGVIIEDTDGNTTFPGAPNIPGVAFGRAVNVAVSGMVRGVNGSLDFLDVVAFPHGVTVGDPIYLTFTSPNQMTNVLDYFGSSTFAGGSVGDHIEFATVPTLLGYAVEVGNPGSIYVVQDPLKPRRTGPIRLDNGIVVHSLRLGGATSPEGDYDGVIPLRTEPGAIEVECYDIDHGAGQTVVRFDIVSMRSSDPVHPDYRNGLLSAHLADLADLTTHTYLGMVTDAGFSPDTGRTLKSTVIGVIAGCAAAFPGGAVDGEVLYLKPGGTLGKLERLVNLGVADPKVPVGRIISTTVLSGIFSVGSDARMAVEAANASLPGALYPPGYIDGFNLWYTGTQQVRVTPGSARSENSAYNIDLASLVTLALPTPGISGIDSFASTGSGAGAAGIGLTALVCAGASFNTEFGTRALTGTLSTVAVVVTGVGSKFLSEVHIDDLVGVAGGGFCRVIEINSDTSMTVSAAFPFGDLPALTSAFLIENPTVYLFSGGNSDYRHVDTIVDDASLTVTTVWGNSHVAAMVRIGEEAADTWFYVWALVGISGVGLALSTQYTTPYPITGYTDGRRLLGAVQNGNASHFMPFQTRNYGKRLDFEEIPDVNILTAGTDAAFTRIPWNITGNLTNAPAIADSMRLRIFIDRVGVANPSAVVDVSAGGTVVHSKVQADINGERQMQDGLWVPAELTGDQAVYYRVTVNYSSNILINGWSFSR